MLTLTDDKQQQQPTQNQTPAGGAQLGDTGAAARAQSTEMGSAVVVGSAADSEWAFDASFTPALVTALQNNPNLSVDEVLHLISDRTLVVNDPDQAVHHPTLAEYGQTAANTSETRGGQRLAVFVANQNYTSIGSLQTPIAESTSFEGAMTGRGYKSLGVKQDQSSGEMAGVYTDLIGQAQPGDDLVAYYAGHGAEDGLVGRDYSSTNNDMFTNGEVAEVVGQATTLGAHIRFIMDSCHSGSAVQAVREQRANELAETTEGLGERLRLAGFEVLTHCKSKLMEHFHARAAALDPMDAQIAQLQNNPPPPGNAAQAQAHAITLANLQTARTAVQQRFDQKADRLWSGMTFVLGLARMALAASTDEDIPSVPKTIDDYRTLGTQLDFIDDLSNAVLEPVDRRVSEDQAN